MIPFKDLNFLVYYSRSDLKIGLGDYDENKLKDFCTVGECFLGNSNNSTHGHSSLIPPIPQ